MRTMDCEQARSQLVPTTSYMQCPAKPSLCHYKAQQHGAGRLGDAGVLTELPGRTLSLNGQFKLQGDSKAGFKVLLPLLYYRVKAAWNGVKAMS
ncbi:UNVERIFIED_CONTAM: hypothetical protein FKN15_058111 [Acipenser sinensis]